MCKALLKTAHKIIEACLQLILWSLKYFANCDMFTFLLAMFYMCVYYKASIYMYIMKFTSIKNRYQYAF